MRGTLLLLFVFVALCGVRGNHLVVGDIGPRTILAKEEIVEYNTLCFMTVRVKTYFYTDQRKRPIVGIQAIDMNQSKASVNITAGGLGQPFVHLLLTSERGSGLHYYISIYVGSLW